MSFARSVMYRYPSSSRCPTSPVCNQPSITVDAVASGLFQYPGMMIGPRSRTSPVSSGPRWAPFAPAIATSTVGIGRPTELGLRRPSAPERVVAADEDSVSP